MKPELYYCKHRDCKSCLETARPAFENLETKKVKFIPLNQWRFIHLYFLYRGKYWFRVMNLLMFRYIQVRLVFGL